MTYYRFTIMMDVCAETELLAGMKLHQALKDYGLFYIPPFQVACKPYMDDAGKEIPQ